ncbi:beta-glucosidase [Dictyobacter alpinus]|uniref:Beta-glucosidase n=1 Tax=Dictyobacter alpinus TaxID=2014873 RepID=A0A402BAN6_9CHLR|nr:GH1 family beta-glucosidase [Dictyobacter alpinus]GCE28453.1 beta-glucosidase [Dictyobacter alpinus]
MNKEQQTHILSSTDAALATSFPKDFLWGAATSAYQIEGAAAEDGRGPSIWDRFAATPGKTYQGETGEIATDHYHRMEQDVALMAELGLRAYRFSISWSRVLPTGTGAVNQAGLDFYSRLVDCLLKHNIQPLATLYHWDLPTALQDQGGWENRATAEAFADYAELMTRHLGDRIDNWITHNEPWCATYLGHGNGVHAPGIKNISVVGIVAHHLLLSHGLAMPRMRAQLKPGARIGIAPNLFPVYSTETSPAVLERVERELDFRNRWFLDPVFKGHYPEHLFKHLGCQEPDIQPGDMELISAPIDFLGMNYYNPLRLQSEQQAGGETTFEVLNAAPGIATTEMGWEVYPQGLMDLLAWLQQSYEIPELIITENGSAYVDQLTSIDGEERIVDEQRLQYFRGHITAISSALAQKKTPPITAYFAWSLMDNYEWAEGYSKRFGIIYVDFATQKRVIKDSGRWYAAFLAAR